MTPDLNNNNLSFEILAELQRRLNGAGICARLILRTNELRLPGFVVGLKFRVDQHASLTAALYGGGATQQFTFKAQDDIPAAENIEALVNRGLSIVNEFTILESRLRRAAFETAHPLPETAVLLS